MTVHHEMLSVHTGTRVAMTDITAQIRAAVGSSSVRNGICSVTSLHTTAALFINENADPDVQRDLVSRLAALVPSDAGYRHAEGNADAHIKAALVGNSVTVPVRDGEPVLGTWQGIFLAEFDGPRERRAMVTVIGE